MARKKTKARSYWEPWYTNKSTTHGFHPFPEGLPPSYPGGVAEGIVEVWERLDKRASWTVWGTNLGSPTVCYSLTDGCTVADGSGIIANVRPPAVPEGGLIGGAITAEQLATRICECVTAMAGIADPVSFVEYVRALMLGYAQGECDDPRTDTRAISPLSRCIPLGQVLETSGYGRDE